MVVPSKLTAPIVRAFCNAVAVEALPVNGPENVPHPSVVVPVAIEQAVDPALFKTVTSFVEPLPIRVMPPVVDVM